MSLTAASSIPEHTWPTDSHTLVEAVAAPAALSGVADPALTRRLLRPWPTSAEHVKAWVMAGHEQSAVNAIAAAGGLMAAGCKRAGTGKGKAID